MIWYHIKKKKPKYDKKPDALGTPVIVLENGEVKQVYYGVRQTKEPNFYLYGAVLQVEWWMPMPEAPGEYGQISAPLPWRVGSKVGNNIYDERDREIGVFFDSEWSKRAVDAVNAVARIQDELKRVDATKHCDVLQRAIQKILDEP